MAVCGARRADLAFGARRALGRFTMLGDVARGAGTAIERGPIPEVTRRTSPVAARADTVPGRDEAPPHGLGEGGELGRDIAAELKEDKRMSDGS